jgi:hypothetical protein
MDEVEMTPANLMVAIRLLVKCDLALETIESGLNVAAPGTKYQYYRAVFLDYEDIIQEQKRVLTLMTDVSDETKQQAFNQLDDYLPEAPPGSSPYSPTSPEYSPVVQSPPIMEYPDWTSETTSEPANTTSEEDNDKHHTSWGEHKKTKGMGACASSYVMYGNVNKRLPVFAIWICT